MRGDDGRLRVLSAGSGDEPRLGAVFGRGEPRGSSEPGPSPGAAAGREARAGRGRVGAGGGRSRSGAAGGGAGDHGRSGRPPPATAAALGTEVGTQKRTRSCSGPLGCSAGPALRTAAARLPPPPLTGATSLLPTEQGVRRSLVGEQPRACPAAAGGQRESTGGLVCFPVCFSVFGVFFVFLFCPEIPAGRIDFCVTAKPLKSAAGSPGAWGVRPHAGCP